MIKRSSYSEKIESNVDLHLHTTASDGMFSPSQLVKIAVELKLDAIAITDHDTVNGIQEALDAARNEDIEIVPGIEFSTEIDSESIHIVGLFVDFQNEKLLKLTNEIQNAREKRAEKIIEKVNSLNLGQKITIDEVKVIADGLIGRPHIGEIMIQKGYAETMNEVFEKYIQRGAPCYVPRFKLTPFEAIKFLKQIKAFPILAHPGYISEEIDLNDFIKKLKKVGLAGIEVYYPSHTDYQIKKFKGLAKKHKLLESGGSDCHGIVNEGPFIGSLRIPYTVFSKIKKKCKK